MERGKLIVLEGIDGCGKSTQINNLSQVFTDHDIPHMCTAEPYEGRTTGKLIRRILKHELPFPGKETMFHLFAAAHYAHTKIIDTALEKGITVLCSRYIYSNFAYNTESMQQATELLELYRDISIVPDMIIWLDITVSVSMERMFGDRLRLATEYYEKYDTLFGASRIYRHMFGGTRIERYSLYAPILYGVNKVLIDATLPPEVITTQLTETLMRTYFQEKL